MLKEFRAFVARGNVLDLAVAVIIGAAFGKIVSSLTDDIIMPVIGKLSGGLDFSSHFLRLGPVPADYKGSLTSYADLKKAGVPLVGYGQFLTQVVDFLIVAFIIFLIVRGIGKAMARLQREQEAAPAAEPTEIVLLREIRDALQSGASTSSSASAKSLPLDGE
jgi:large conductance mechanosensitive channel